MHGIDYAPPYLPGSATTDLGLVRVVYIYIHTYCYLSQFLLHLDFPVCVVDASISPGVHRRSHGMEQFNTFRSTSVGVRCDLPWEERVVMLINRCASYLTRLSRPFDCDLCKSIRGGCACASLFAHRGSLSACSVVRLLPIKRSMRIAGNSARENMHMAVVSSSVRVGVGAWPSDSVEAGAWMRPLAQFCSWQISPLESRPHPLRVFLFFPPRTNSCCDAL